LNHRQLHRLDIFDGRMATLALVDPCVRVPRKSRGAMYPGDVERPTAHEISEVESFRDGATVKRYGSLAGPSIELYGGRFVVSNTQPVVVEGDSPSRHLSMVEFPSIEQARTWYDSPEYAEARKITPDAFVDRVLMFVEGITGPR
jgi:uncharacterized protein (DUF1330 family)